MGSLFSRIVKATRPAGLAVVGEPISYQQLPNDPLTVTAIRCTRDPLETSEFAAFESIWTTIDQFPSPPQKGDRVFMANVVYIVMSIKPDGDPSNGVKFYLNRLGPASPLDPNA